ncbi:class I SAM-dependent methyltransferase [Corticimicrobacter populi]|uniref:Methyltransferase n=1 Tax=Corticimicrobacter populi TaxID=2175229 RepID=A0A2V1JY45_9BURK|nr:class I SAM-dependent methyltransferase [Corticimicrobacter populi]PWF21227.1 hypothetical protein DD235_15525 [Corticimicrobacter populi]
MSSFLYELESLGIILVDRLQPFHPTVRDRDDVSVLRDPLTEVIVLSGADHMSLEYYQQREGSAGQLREGNLTTLPRLADNIRRAQDFGPILRNRRWLDFGSGLGGMLDEMRGQAAWSAGLEPNRERAALARQNGHTVFNDLSEVDDGALDIVTMFHVLEHLTAPVDELVRVREHLRPGGRLLVEVPHARDALFSLYDCEAFKQFTFWSEHLILHTRQSLAILLEKAGFVDIEVSGFQRYPLANHLHWLARGKPGGQEAWSLLNTAGLAAEYEAALSRVDRTDSLIALCRAP